MELQRVISEFLTYTKVEKCASELTLAAYRSDIKVFMFYWERLELPVALLKITPAIVRRCLFTMQEEKNWKASTLNRRWDTYRSLFAFALEQEYTDRHPMLKIRSPKADKTVPYYLRADELDRLLATPARRRWKSWQRDQAVLCLLAYTGIRRAELLVLTWDDIRFDERTVLVKGKGRKQRVLPMNSILDATLWEYMHSQLPLAGKALFYNRDGLPLKRGNLQDLFKRCVRHAGLDPKKVTLHKIRHSFATLLLGAGTDIRTIQELLGHSEVGSTQVYAHTSPAQARKAVERLTKEEPDEERGRPT